MILRRAQQQCQFTSHRLQSRRPYLRLAGGFHSAAHQYIEANRYLTRGIPISQMRRASCCCIRESDGRQTQIDYAVAWPINWLVRSGGYQSAVVLHVDHKAMVIRWPPLHCFCSANDLCVSVFAESVLRARVYIEGSAMPHSQGRNLFTFSVSALAKSR